MATNGAFQWPPMGSFSWPPSLALREGEQLLTPRQLEVVTEIAMGRRINEIAEALGVAPTTVKTHIDNAMKRMGARSQAQLVAVVLCHGFLDLGGCRPNPSQQQADAPRDWQCGHSA